MFVRLRRVELRRVCAAARTHSPPPAHPFCTRPCCSASRKRARVRARVAALCAWPGARVRPRSDLEPPRSSREPLHPPPPSSTSAPPTLRTVVSLPCVADAAIALSLSLSGSPPSFRFPLLDERHAASDGLETRSELIDREFFGLLRGGFCVRLALKAGGLNVS